MTPLELALMIPFIKAGDILTGSSSLHGTEIDSFSVLKTQAPQLILRTSYALISSDFLPTFGLLYYMVTGLISIIDEEGIFAWALFMILVTWILYKILVPIIHNFQKRKYSLD